MPKRNPSSRDAVPTPNPATASKSAVGKCSSSRHCSKKQSTCDHSIFCYIDERTRMLCARCGRRRKIKFYEDGTATVGRWVKPRKKESNDA